MVINILLLVLILLILMILKIYNDLIKLKNNVKQASSTIDVYLNKRFDLIPNLVECVKSYMEYEEETLKQIVEKRSNYNKTEGLNIKQAEDINNTLNHILLVAENNPNLKASDQFVNLQKNLSTIENELQAARRIYNIAVTSYNNNIEIVPNNIVAKIFRFKKEELFKTENEKKQNIDVEV